MLRRAYGVKRCGETRVLADGGIRWICTLPAGHPPGHCFWNLESPAVRLAAAEARAERYRSAYLSARRRAQQLQRLQLVPGGRS